MKRNGLIWICCYALLVAFGACSKPDGDRTPVQSSGPPAGPKVPPETIVRVSASETEIRAGGSAQAAVRLQITDGYHVNANPPTHPYLIATQLDVAPEDLVKPGQPVYPAPLTKKFAFDPKPLAVYEREATIELPLRAESQAPKGPLTLRARVRVQPCDDQACYPPRTIETSIPVTIN